MIRQEAAGIYAAAAGLRVLKRSSRSSARSKTARRLELLFGPT